MSTNERLARFMGWRYAHEKGGKQVLIGGNLETFKCYDSDLNAMREVEAELERRGLWGDYICELHKLIGEAPPADYFGIGHSIWMRFKFATAPASVRAEAAARVIPEEED